MLRDGHFVCTAAIVTRFFVSTSEWSAKTCYSLVVSIWCTNLHKSHSALVFVTRSVGADASLNVTYNYHNYNIVGTRAVLILVHKTFTDAKIVSHKKYIVGATALFTFLK